MKTAYLMPIGIPVNVNEKYYNSTGPESPRQKRDRLLNELIQKLKSEGVNLTVFKSGITELPPNPFFDPLRALPFFEQAIQLQALVNSYQTVAKDILANTSGKEKPTDGGTTGGGGTTNTGGDGSNDDEDTQDEPKKILGMTYKQATITGAAGTVVIVLGILFLPKLFKKIAGTKPAAAETK